MVIFPIVEEQDKSKSRVPIWKAIEEAQSVNTTDYWLITQPAHAALAGELAASLRGDLFGPIDATVSRSIALHDSGWSMDDAEQIQKLRSNPKLRPNGFLDASTDQALHAWTGSIETVEKFAPIGGYLVSRHFESLSRRDKQEARAKIEHFQEREAKRQERLRTKIKQDPAALELLVNALQFCDVLSLYLCCGSNRTVEIDDHRITISRNGGDYKLEPNPFKGPSQFAFSALRHPARGGQKAKSGAIFYINL
jgi:Protein of unknown function (DUF3891)